MKRLKNVSGQRFGSLTARSVSRVGRKTIWLCDCDCGGAASVALGQLQSGKTRSCGCLRSRTAAARVKSHGMSQTPEYQAYRNAYYRCTREKDPRYTSYGERGIEFRFSDFVQFFEDVGFRPSADHSLDRIDTDGHYEPGNVRWAKRKAQARNKTTNRLVNLFGEERPLSEWCEILGVPYKRAHDRIVARGWSAERALEVAK